MAQVYTCKHCGKVLGAMEYFSYIGSGIIETTYSKPDGKCEHLEIKECEKNFLFNFIKEKTFLFPETETKIKQLEYSGPKNLFILWICMSILRIDKILIQEKWIYKEKFYFSGSGLKFFK